MTDDIDEAAARDVWESLNAGKHWDDLELSAQLHFHSMLISFGRAFDAAGYEIRKKPTPNPKYDEDARWGRFK